MKQIINSVLPTPAPRGFAVGGSPTALPAPVAPARPSQGAVESTAVAAAAAASAINGATLLLQAGSEVAIAKIVRTGERKLTRGKI